MACIKVVAHIARRSGVEVVDVFGLGERKLRASNATAESGAQKRCLEIFYVSCGQGHRNLAKSLAVLGPIAVSGSNVMKLSYSNQPGSGCR